jgi:hypothetical protein
MHAKVFPGVSIMVPLYWLATERAKIDKNLHLMKYTSCDQGCKAETQSMKMKSKNVYTSE